MLSASENQLGRKLKALAKYARQNQIGTETKSCRDWSFWHAETTAFSSYSGGAAPKSTAPLCSSSVTTVFRIAVLCPVDTNCHYSANSNLCQQDKEPHCPHLSNIASSTLKVHAIFVMVLHVIPRLGEIRRALLWNTLLSARNLAINF